MTIDKVHNNYVTNTSHITTRSWHSVVAGATAVAVAIAEFSHVQNRIDEVASDR
jgi:hypothetical protein